MTHRINLWSGPRNISTAMMYSFAQRSDTVVVDEPLYAHYLSKTGLDHPGREAILRSQEMEAESVVKNVILKDYPRPVVFFKQMTHHLIGMDLDFLSQCSHVLLIRDPRQVIKSYSKVIKNPRVEDLGIWQNAGLWHYLNENDIPTTVLDSTEMLKNPEGMLRSLCAKLDIPFEPNMLQWSAGAREEDGVWAPFWYSSVHQSTCFSAPKESEIELPDHLQPILEEAMPYYHYLKEIALSC